MAYKFYREVKIVRVDVDSLSEQSDGRLTTLERLRTLDEAIELIAKLETKEQIVVLARFLGLDYKEIGKLLGLDKYSL